MNWMQSLYETYEQCAKRGLVGYVSGTKRPLLPICHITIQAHIEVVIDGCGNFRRAQLVSKDDAVTIIPATESSASRSGSKPECHPLCDKLQYLAGDFVQYGGKVTSGFQSNPAEPHQNFVTLLSDWQSKRPHPKVSAILKYIKKKTLMTNLVNANILLVDCHGQLLTKDNVEPEKRRGTIFDVLNDQGDAVVRWVVEIPGYTESRVWRDTTVWDSWIDYYLNHRSGTSEICFVIGERQRLTNNHPKYIRREGDNAKLISSNDAQGFTFRGRFITDEQACSVSLEASHKAHYALMWLIDRQGYRDGDLAIVAWAISGATVTVPQPTDDPIATLFGDLPSDDKSIDTAQDVAIRLKKKIAGYRQEIGDRTDVVVIGVDSATPGRLAVIYYRTLKGSDFLDRIETWHDTCAWRHTYRVIEERDTNGKLYRRRIPFIGAPAPADIAEAAYGRRLDDRLKQATIKRLLPCIVDGQPLPRDLVESAVRRASNPVGLSDDQREKVLTIACALYRKYMYGKEQYDMALDETRRTRDYLYGRLLAIADVIEERALYKAEQNRPTNAIRYMQQFSQRPFRTWKQIHDLLMPYLMRLGGRAYYYKNLIAEVESMFTPEDFVSTRSLSGEYLLGFYCQRQKLLEKRADDREDDNDGTSI
ncbi:type I-C CRISPR-associated protein Cas8c/Csd1 [Chloroflexus sp. Y-396-1]|uniref:type I-C CRISPR-associated protein Cas8c/Csd1 n=1 Tax=Chloroflexus sp. Y-396-1 TaxID=867845 RepID=UPI00048BEC81|nr:type I-C CRISPR-associated protein Cas8c/Csd1 [Chloroflexus sp. Y-396-1]